MRRVRSGGRRWSPTRPGRSPSPSGPCAGIPSDASAYSLNFTVIGGSGVFTNAFLTAWPTGDAQPTVSTLNFNANQLEANAAVVPAGTSGSINVFVNAPAHLLIDINGYYAGSVVTTLNGLSGDVTLAAGIERDDHPVREAPSTIDAPGTVLPSGTHESDAEARRDDLGAEQPADQ